LLDRCGQRLRIFRIGDEIQKTPQRLGDDIAIAEPPQGPDQILSQNRDIIGLGR
jgi:hypothetical protein